MNFQQILSQKNINSESTIKSRISPIISYLLYYLGNYLILPSFFSKIQITGRENIPQNNPVIVTPTHRSRWDAFIIPYAIGKLYSRRNLRFMVSDNEIKGIQGWFIRRMGCFPVNTKQPKAGSINHSLELLKSNSMIVIFPEGNIFRDDKVHQLKRGAALVALESQLQQINKEVEILPVSIKYSDPYPRWKTNVAVNIGSTLKASDYLGTSLRKSSQNLTQVLQTKLQKMTAKNLDYSI